MPRKPRTTNLPVGIRAKQRADGTTVYQAAVWDKAAGRNRRREFPTLTAAKLWRADAITALAAGQTPEPARAGGRLIRDALTDLVAGMQAGTILDRSGRPYAPSTIRGYHRDAKRLTSALGHLPLTDPKVRRDLQALIDTWHAEGVRGSTIRNRIEPLRVVYRRAIQDNELGATSYNPTHQLRLPAHNTQPRNIGDVARVEALLDRLPDNERPLWAAAFYAGLRMGELRALRWRDVDFAASRIRVEHGWDDIEGQRATKTSAGRRTIPLAGRLRDELVLHGLETGRGPDDLVFGETAARPPIRSTLRARALRAWGAEPALAPLTPHEARHTCASYLAAAGLTPKEVQTAMGHADIRTTLNLYAKAVPGWEAGAAAKLDAYLDLT